MIDDYTPYGIEGFCAPWRDLTQRSGPSYRKPAYRCAMIVQTSFGAVVVPGRELSAPVRLSRVKALKKGMDATGEFETAPRRRRYKKGLPARGRRPAAERQPMPSL